VSQYLRVMPHERMGDMPVPLGNGQKLSRADAPANGFLIMDSHFIRRRVSFNELVILAEGAAATAEPAPAAAGRPTPQAGAPPAPQPSAAGIEVKS
jgi:hypothetical protein